MTERMFDRPENHERIEVCEDPYGHRWLVNYQGESWQFLQWEEAIAYADRMARTNQGENK